MKKIALYLPSLRGGGAERVMVNLANAFADRGFKTDLVLVEADGPYLKDVSKAVSVVDLNASRVLFSLSALVRYLRRERPQVMLSAMNHANVLALLARKVANVETNMVVSERNNLTQSLRKPRSIRARLLPIIMRYIYPLADAVIAVSDGVAENLSSVTGLPRARITTIYNPVVTPKLLKLAKESIEHPWFAPDQPPVILGVGRLTLQKDFHTLIHGFAKLREQRPLHLVILGEGELRTELEDLVGKLGLSQEVLLPSFVENPYAWMRKSALFVLSSAWEGLPAVLIEAMACGTRVISTDCPSGPAEILENGKWGRLVPVGDIDALATAMLTTLDDPNPPHVKKRAADFSLERSVDDYLHALGFNDG